MLFPSTPDNESIRLQALQELCILDTPSEERFDAITQFASTVLNAPICLVSFVDKERQWFKSHQGLDIKQTPRYMSFCAHAICGSIALNPDSRFFEIYDTHQDIRFADNPLVTDAPLIRSYIGYVLMSKSSMNIGTLCIIDNKPRRYSKDEKDLIKVLGEIVQNLINQNQFFPA